MFSGSTLENLTETKKLLRNTQHRRRCVKTCLQSTWSHIPTTVVYLVINLRTPKLFCFSTSQLRLGQFRHRLKTSLFRQA